MTYDEIAQRLQRASSADDLHALQLACDARRREIRSRQAEIADYAPPTPPTPARAAAMAEGVGALAELDHEAESLNREFQALNRIETEIVARADRHREMTARAAAPKARRELPAAMRRVREALAALDAAIAGVSKQVEPLSAVAGLRGEPFPLSDAELAALLELREEIWARRDLPVLIPADRETHPKAFAIFHQISNDGFGERVIRRPPPSRVHLPDLVIDDSPIR